MTIERLFLQSPDQDIRKDLIGNFTSCMNKNITANETKHFMNTDLDLNVENWKTQKSLRLITE